MNDIRHEYRKSSSFWPVNEPFEKPPNDINEYLTMKIKRKISKMRLREQQLNNDYNFRRPDAAVQNAE